jgi:hypothetical protein
MVYVALAAGVLIYAAVAFLVVGPIESGLDSALMRIAWLAVAVGATLVAGIVTGRLHAGEYSEGRAMSAAILVWALAEGQAFLGLTGYLVTGDTLIATLSLALFAYLYLRYPPGAFRERRPR